MSGHLCLKWNNHSTAFIKSISNIQIKERYCDATIACQGKYFPVHRVVLSTCSDYFDEIFERIDCPHPYIIFKDIEPREMELLLNYMYQGEVNVVQENLPTLIKAAEALKVKGLAVPDDLPASKDSSSSKKRSSDTPLPKRRSEEKRRRRDSSDQNSHPNSSSTTSDRITTKSDVDNKIIKEEPLESAEYENPPMRSEYGEAGFSGGSDSTPAEPSQVDPVEKPATGEAVFVGFPGSEETENFIKSEDPGPTEPYNEEQSSSWSDFTGGDIMQDLPETSTQDDMFATPSMSKSDLISEDTPQERSLNEPDNCYKSSSGFYTCSYCDYSSATKATVKRHVMFKHTGEKHAQCNLCTRWFTTKEQLKLHVRVHTGEKPYKCLYCSLKYSQRCHLTRHVLNKHQSTNN